MSPAFIHHHDFLNLQGIGDISKQQALSLIPLYGSECLFLRDQPSFCKARPIVARLTFKAWLWFHSWVCLSTVASSCSRTWCANTLNCPLVNCPVGRRGSVARTCPKRL